MARTYQNIIDEARETLQDTDSEGYRYTTAMLLNLLNRGLQELARLRPDAFYDTFVTEDIVVPEIAEAGLGADFGAPMMFYPAMVYWVIGSAELIEDEFATDGRAVTLLTNFKQMVIGL
jgi:hypothetical protein